MRPPIATVKQFDFSSEPRTFEHFNAANETSVSRPVEAALVEDVDQVIRITIPAQP